MRDPQAPSSRGDADGIPWNQLAEPSLESLQTYLNRYGQSHLVRFWTELTQEQRTDWGDDLRQIDLEQVTTLNQTIRAGVPTGQSLGQVAPPPAYRLSDSDSHVGAIADQVGDALLRSGTIGVVIVAGGQGTRLGFPHPKGMFPIGPLSGSTLFQIYVEKILALRQRYSVEIPLYLMTSVATHDETVRFFAEHKNFGLPASDVFFFRQGVMPTVDDEGKMMLSDKGRISLSPDGHGGMLTAMTRAGAFDDMRDRGIEQLLYLQIDNALVEIGNPRFLGLHVVACSDVTTAATCKTTPLAKVGNVVAVDGKIQIIEYSDMPLELAEQRNEDGSLHLWAGSMAMHCMAVKFLEQYADEATALPFHFARKKVPYIDDSGSRIEPPEPNATKFERFIFDLLPACRRALVVEVDPDECYCPLKNAPGGSRNSPEHVQQRLSDLHRRWLQSAGVHVADGIHVEISPLWAHNALAAKERASAGMRIEEDTYLR